MGQIRYGCPFGRRRKLKSAGTRLLQRPDSVSSVFFRVEGFFCAIRPSPALHRTHEVPVVKRSGSAVHTCPGRTPAPPALQPQQCGASVPSRMICLANHVLAARTVAGGASLSWTDSPGGVPGSVAQFAVSAHAPQEEFSIRGSLGVSCPTHACLPPPHSAFTPRVLRGRRRVACTACKETRRSKFPSPFMLSCTLCPSFPSCLRG